MGKDLSHLTPDEIETLMYRYYKEREPVSTLLEDYNIDVEARELCKLFPPEISDNYICEYCGVHLVRDRRSRSFLKPTDYGFYCPECGHAPFATCSCHNCCEKQRKVKMRQREKLEEYFSEFSNPIDYQDLSFTNKVLLGAVCRCLLNKERNLLLPYNDSKLNLAPNYEYVLKILNQLLDSKIIIPSMITPLEAFTFDDNHNPTAMSLGKCYYLLNLKIGSRPDEFFEQILNPPYSSEESANEVITLWKKIAAEECIEYLNFQLKKYKFGPTFEETIYETFDTLLNSYSESEIFAVIWHAVGDISRLYAKGYDKKYCVNCLRGSMENYVERSQKGGWDISQYNRPYALPQSELSIFFFYKVLKIGDLGFSVPPTIV